MRALRQAIQAVRPDSRLTRSELERRALRLIARAKLPRPLTNTRVHGYEADLYWPVHDLVVELDSHAHHLDTGSFENDRRRDVDLHNAGITTLRFTYRQLTSDPDWVAARLRAATGAGA